VESRSKVSYTTLLSSRHHAVYARHRLLLLLLLLLLMRRRHCCVWRVGAFASEIRSFACCLAQSQRTRYSSAWSSWHARSVTAAVVCVLTSYTSIRQCASRCLLILLLFERYSNDQPQTQTHAPTRLNLFTQYGLQRL